VQLSVLAAKQFDDRETYGVRSKGRSSGKHAVRPVVERRCAELLEVASSIKLPEDEQMRETLDGGQPEFGFWQNF
jgi:hypothetical protein